MAKFRLTNKAQADLRRIGRDTQQNWGREQRNIYLGKLDSSFHQLADNPCTGQARADTERPVNVHTQPAVDCRPF